MGSRLRKSDIGTPNDPDWYEDDLPAVKHPSRRYRMFDLNERTNKWKSVGQAFSAASFLKYNRDAKEQDLPASVGDERTFGGGAQPITKIKRIL